MLQYLPNVDPATGLILLGGLVVAGFLVSFVATDRLGIPRFPYVGILALVTGGLGVSYYVWSGAGMAFWITNWPWGLLGAGIVGGLLFAGVSRIAVQIPHRESGATLLAWDAILYGAVEGLLLSVLPVAIAWQILGGVGWTSGLLGVVAGVAALASSGLVIATHHLGYKGFRGKEMVFPVVGCVLLSLAYLVTGSVIAPMVGHMILHVGLMRRGSELPPFEQAPIQLRHAATAGAG